MYKMKIIIADYDSKYLSKMADYLNSSILARFKVSAFSKPGILADYLCSAGEKINILLAHPDFLKFAEDSYKNVEVILQLFDGSIDCFNEKYQPVNKYIPGDKMASELVKFYAEKNSHAARLISGSKRTKFVPVYSASGGTGKSTMTLGLAAKLGRLGKTTLVLSFESLNSIFPVIPESGNDVFSRLVFAAIDNPGTLPVKLEAYKLADTQNNFEFIAPPECFYEVSELRDREAGLLLDGLKQMGKYDIILADMESKPDKLALEILRQSDQIVFVMTGDICCTLKTEQFLRQISREESFSKAGFTNKILPVLNKYDGGAKGLWDRFGLSCPFTVPVFAELWSCENGRCRFDAWEHLSDSLSGIAHALTEPTGF